MKRSSLRRKSTLRSGGPFRPGSKKPKKQVSPRKPKLKPLNKLKKDADKYFSIYVRLRDSDQFGMSECITCGVKKHWKELQNGHFVSRRVMALRYDELNCHAQCYSCNVMRYGEQYQYAKNIDMKYGDGTARSLHDRRHDTHKFSREELEAIISDAKDYIDSRS